MCTEDSKALISHEFDSLGVYIPGVNTGNSIPCFESESHSRIPRRLKERCITWHERNSTPNHMNSAWVRSILNKHG